MILPAFVGAAVLVAMVPGPSTAMILRQTVRAGRGAGFATVLGNETGILVWGLAAALGLSALVAASEVAYGVLRVAGAAVLVAFGAQSLLRARGGRPAPAEAPPAPPATPRRSYALGMVTVLANPKAAVFAISFLPQFVPAGSGVPLTAALLAVVWAVVDTAWYGVLIWLVGRARSVVERPAVRRRLERVSGVVLIGLGLRVATESR
jgi:threonine/homoserine/homoserine lactone efflux protein